MAICHLTPALFRISVTANTSHNFIVYYTSKVHPLSYPLYAKKENINPANNKMFCSVLNVFWRFVALKKQVKVTVLLFIQGSE